jgi:hypothetical protein
MTQLPIGHGWQVTRYRNHPSYIVGATWRSNTGLMSSSGQYRPALTWLEDLRKSSR